MAPLVLFLTLAAGEMAMAHQVPSLTVEALFSADRSYTLRINLDPRLILSDQPSSLPPVPIEWYRDQKPDELAVTKKNAAEYLLRALTLHFDGTTRQLNNCEFQPMDGATNMPLSADTKEVHLLAVARGAVPDAQKSFALELSRDANVSMILMNSFEGTTERRPNVIFPGETSRPFVLVFPAKPMASPMVETSVCVAKNETRRSPTLWVALVGGVLLAILAALLASRGKG